MSDGRLRALAAVLALAGLAIAIYLTVLHYDHSAPVCVGGGGGCEKVQSSDYAELATVPVALLGAVGYALIALSLLLPDGASRFAGALLGTIGFGFSMYLTFLELFVIDAICQWCVASAVVMTALAAVTLIRFLRPSAPA